MLFNVQIINHTLPAISVSVADGGNGVGGVTYAELKQSLGQQVYDVGCLYLYSDNQTQLAGIINYNIFDVNGNAKVTNIVTTIDPYQFVGSLLVNLKDKVNIPIILNGNSSVSTTVQPNTFFQVKFLADRITNKVGLINSNFTQMEELTGTKFFEGTYSEGGDAMSCSGRDNLITGQSTNKTDIIQDPQVLKKYDVLQPPSVKKMGLDCNIFLLIASVSAGLYLFSKKD
tara:strand:- start:145 stop:831 length:687 start_codon:yes stop_codon:yes gene_type:complete